MKSINFSFKRVAALALAALLLLSLMPALTLNARADVPQPVISGLWVGDSAEVTAAGEISNTGASGTASVRLDGDDLILTLNNFVYSGEGHKETGEYYAGASYTKQYGIYYAVPDDYFNIRIELIGENKLTLKSIPSGKDSTTDSSIGIYCKTGKDDFSLTICGDGSLEVSAGEAGKSYGIAINGNLTFKGGKTTVTSGDAEESYGIRVNSDLTVNGGEITVTSGVAKGGASSAIGVDGNITISGGTVIAKAGKTEDNDDCSFGIYSDGLVSITGGTVQAYGADLSVKKAPSFGIISSGFLVSGGDVTAVGGNAAKSGGIVSEYEPIIITDGKITAKSGNAEANSGAISAAELKISGGSVNAESGDANKTSAAISADEELIISGGNVSAITGTASYTYGIYSEKGSVAISGGVVRAEPKASSGGGDSCAILAKNNIDLTGGEIYALSNFRGISVDDNNTATVTVGDGVSYLEAEGNHAAIGGGKLVINQAGKGWGDNNGTVIEKEIAKGEYKNLVFELEDGNKRGFIKVIFGSKTKPEPKPEPQPQPEPEPEPQPQPQPSTNTNIPHRPVTPSTPSSPTTDKQDKTEDKSETVTNNDGSKTETKTNADGSKTETTTKTDGSKTETTTAKDGSSVTENTAADGSKGEVKTNAEGNTVSAEATVSEKAVEAAAKAGESVKVQVEVKAASAEKAAPVTVTLPKTEAPVRVEIPVENVTASTVAVIVYDDGREEIVKTSTTGEDGVVLSLEGSATVKIVDNAKDFGDVKADDWYASSVAWAASHEVMNGVGGGSFEPNADTSRGMIAQLLFNLDGAEASGDTAAFKDVAADDWFAGAVTWMVDAGIAKGQGESFGANDSVTREQLAVMLYNYAQHKGYDTTAQGDVSSFGDADGVSDYAKDALAWAVGVGLINGTTDKDGNIVLDAQGSATRAQVAAIIERFCDKVAK